MIKPAYNYYTCQKCFVSTGFGFEKEPDDNLCGNCLNEKEWMIKWFKEALKEFKDE